MILTGALPLKSVPVAEPNLAMTMPLPSMSYFERGGLLQERSGGAPQ